VGTKRYIHLIVADDGVGVAPDEQRKGKSIGVGIVGMEGRVRELGGRFSMRGVDKGTLLSVSLPRIKSNV